MTMLLGICQATRASFIGPTDNAGISFPFFLNFLSRKDFQNTARLLNFANGIIMTESWFKISKSNKVTTPIVSVSLTAATGSPQRVSPFARYSRPCSISSQSHSGNLFEKAVALLSQIETFATIGNNSFGFTSTEATERPISIHTNTTTQNLSIRYNIPNRST